MSIAQSKRERLIALPALRASLSDVWVPKYRQAVQLLLKQHAREAAVFVRDGAELDSMRETWEQKLVAAQWPIAVAMAQEGYTLAEGELGKTSALDALYAKAVEEVVIGFGPETEELLIRKMQPNVMGWLESRTKSMVGHELDYMSSVVHTAMADGETVGGIARALQTTMLQQSRWRAERIARSATIWNYNEGAEQFYADSGVAVEEWLVTQDDMLCEFCTQMDGIQIPIEDTFFGPGTTLESRGGGAMNFEFAVEHPPLHPNCRCALVPVL